VLYERLHTCEQNRGYELTTRILIWVIKQVDKQSQKTNLWSRDEHN